MFGKAFSEDGKAFDQADLRFPEVEPSGAFIATRFVTIAEQTVGSCVDFDRPCGSSSGGGATSGGEAASLVVDGAGPVRDAGQGDVSGDAGQGDSAEVRKAKSENDF